MPKAVQNLIRPERPGARAPRISTGTNAAATANYWHPLFPLHETGNGRPRGGFIFPSSLLRRNPSTMASAETSAIPEAGTGRFMPFPTWSNKLSDYDATGVIRLDPWLEPHRDVLKHRYSLVEKWAKDIEKSEGGLDRFSKVDRSTI